MVSSAGDVLIICQDEPWEGISSPDRVKRLLGLRFVPRILKSEQTTERGKVGTLEGLHLRTTRINFGEE